MADLLECLLQIKGLHGTIERVTALVERTPADRWTTAASDLVARMAEAEVINAAAVRLMLAEAGALLPYADPAALLALARRRGWTPQQALDRFAARRRDNLEILDHCTAEELSRVGVHPRRRDMTLADLVAVMLGNDVEQVGEVRRALE